jgi:hypothetical protein
VALIKNTFQKLHIALIIITYNDIFKSVDNIEVGYFAYRAKEAYCFTLVECKGALLKAIIIK